MVDAVDGELDAGERNGRLDACAVVTVACIPAERAAAASSCLSVRVVAVGDGIAALRCYGRQLVDRAARVGIADSGVPVAQLPLAVVENSFTRLELRS